ncbi:MAG TPA: hydroxyphenylacetyl-CoA thioesterase PaaI [Terrimesophilobacter sp.]|nr:hydroxyphenylacetyl-CoA thioesterase PaaI [Terrimesophilobacter sp.]
MSDAASGTYERPDTMLRDDRASTELLGMDVVEMSEDHAIVTMVVRDDMVNGHQIVHGGLVFTLADTAFAMACNSEGSVTVSSGAEITYYAPGRAGDLLTATAQVRSRRGRSVLCDVEVRNAQGIIAEFRGHGKTVTQDRLHAERSS